MAEANRLHAEPALDTASAPPDETIQTIPQGVVVFDDNQRLVAFNPAFAELFEFAPDFLRPGMPIADIIRDRAERGLYGAGDVEEHVRHHVDRSKMMTERAEERTLSNGKAYTFHRRPMSGGGFVTTYTDITEGKKKERKLLERLENFRSAFNNAGIGIFIRSPDGEKRQYNRALCDMLGYTAEELRSMRMRDIAHPGDDPETTSMRFVSFGDRDTETIERRFIRKDGKVIWCNISYKSVYDTDGQPLSIIGTYQEITERKQAEQEAAEKSHLLETTIKTMAQGYVVFDAGLRLVAFNGQYEKMFDFPADFLRPGLSLEDVLRHRGSCWLGSTSSGDRDRIERHVERARNPVEHTRERDLTNGLTYIYHRKPLPGGGYLTTYTDITDSKRVERESAEKSLLLEKTLENMSHGFCVFDDQARLVAFNQKFVDLYGFPEGFVHIGMRHEDLVRHLVEEGFLSIVGEDIEEAVRRRVKSAERGEARINETELPNGTYYQYARVPLPDGGFVATYTDITERRRAEEQLHQAQKMEAVGQLTGGIAHDFNNLLAVSLGNVEMAEEAVRSGGDVQPFLTTVKRAGERGASLTNQLLAFSRNQKLFPEVIDAGELVDAITDLLRRSLGETIEVEVEGQDDLWPCEVDPHQLESAILNLAINARDAMPDGGTLRIRTANFRLDDDAAARTEAGPGDYVLLEVADTGSGMPQDVIDHAFDPFFTTKEVGRGSGLGLSMVYGFVNQSGGRVAIRSQEGEGTAISLYLPRSARAVKQVGRAGRTAVPESCGETVMVVEDNPDVRTMSAEMLSGLGYEIFEAADGESALKALEAAPAVDLLFTDVVLPGGMSGPELAANVHSRYPGIAVLYTSGYTELADFEESTLHEEVELLKKPYRKADLARKIRLALDRAKP